MRKFIITSILEGFDQQIRFFEWWYRFSFNNLGLALLMVFKLCASVEKMLKLQLGKFWGVIIDVWRSYRRKTARGLFRPPTTPPPSWILLNNSIWLSMLISLLCLVFGDIVTFFWKSWRNKKKNNTRKMFTLLQWVLQYVIIFTCSYAKPCRNKQFCLHLSMINSLYSILQVWRLL